MRFQTNNYQALADGPQTVQLTIDTSDVFGHGDRVSDLQGPGLRSSIAFAGMILPLMALLGSLGRFSKRSRIGLPQLFLLLTVTVIGLGAQGCSAKLPGETPPGSYNISVTAGDAGAATTLSHSFKIHLTVKPNS